MDDETSSILNLMGSAAIGGGLVGAGAKLLSPSLRHAPGTLGKLKALAKAGLLGSATTAGLVGLGGAVGQEILGQPTEQEQEEGSPWTRRAGLGGAIGGGIVGATLGGLHGAGSLRKLAGLIPEKILARGNRALSDIPTDNVLFDYLKKLGKRPNVTSAIAGATVGGVGLGGLAGYLGADEGMQADVLEDERRALLKRKMGVQ